MKRQHYAHWLQLPKWLTQWLQPRSTTPVERFVEQILRVYLPIGMLIPLFGIPTTILYTPDGTHWTEVVDVNRWWIVFFCVAFLAHVLAFLALYRNKLRLATLGMVIVYFVSTWGTVLVARPGNPIISTSFTVELLVLSMSVLNRQAILPIMFLSVGFVAAVVALQGIRTLGQETFTYMGVVIDLTLPFFLQGFILYAIRREIDAHLIALDRARLDADSARQQAEAASQAKSEFLAAISHELRTPLALINLNTESLLAGTYEAGTVPLPEQLPPLERIRRAGTRLMALLDNLFDYLSLEQRVDLTTRHVEDGNIAFIERLVADMKPLAESKGLTLTLTIAPGIQPEQVVADRARLQPMLTNLIDNAIKFSDHGHVRVDMRRNGQSWQIAVHDMGVGIPPEQASRIFDPFYQVDTGDARCHAGMGLGLSIVKAIVSQLGGTISVNSQPLHGTTFTVTLPMLMTLG